MRLVPLDVLPQLFFSLVVVLARRMRPKLRRPQLRRLEFRPFEFWLLVRILTLRRTPARARLHALTRTRKDGLRVWLR